MKIGTLLTAAIVSLSAVGGGLAVYVAASKYQTMDKVSVAQSRLELVRAVGEIPRYMNPERGFATNIMFGPPAVDPKLLTELDKYRKNTDGARDKMNKVKATLPGAIDDSAAVGSSIDALNTQFAALRTAMDKALSGPAEPAAMLPGKSSPTTRSSTRLSRRCSTSRCARSRCWTARPTGKQATPISPGRYATSAVSTRACTRISSAATG